MSVINNAFGSGYAPPGALSEFELPASGGFAQAAPPASTSGPLPPYLPIETPHLSVGGGTQSSQTDPWNFSAIMNAIGNAISGLFQQLGSTLGGLGSQTPGAPAPGSGESYFSSAAASSVGDPHLSFDGKTSAGTSVDQKWDSMRSHADLLCSDSFAGGYRVSTQVTAPNAKGATQNASASVTAGGGAASVTMEANGSYAVTAGGSPVTLQRGQPAALGNGELVTLNADGSLTVADRNAQGGSISTTLRANGSGGVDVSTSAHQVDLGGYLVNQNEGPANAPSTGAPAYPLLPPSMISDLTPFDPENAATGLSSIEAL